MPDAVRATRGPVLPLPGFMPDAVSYASRVTLALLLAYFVSFAIQLDTASSAGVCVAIVMQPSTGMAVSKAFYRVLGTVLGGAVALVIIAAFPQDRTMLLAAFAVWLGICTYVASLLHDFRSYGAALSGYTVGIIAVLGIDNPSASLATTLNRVAAILVGVVCVCLVNSVFSVDSAHEELCAKLGRHLDDLQSTAIRVLDRQGTLEEQACLQQAADILALRTLATYATGELADGLRRNRAAQGAIAALLAMLAATRTLSQFLPPAGTALPPTVGGCLRASSDAIRMLLPPPSHARLPSEPLDALLTERATELASEHWKAQAWLQATLTGMTADLPIQVRLRSDPDRIAALLNAVRVMIAFGLAAAFCVLGNDSSVGLVLVIMPALTALLGMQPNPSTAISNFLPAVPVAALVAGVIGFVALPLASGFGLFALAVGPGVFVLGLASRHPRTARFGPPMLIYFAVLLAPSNTETFNLLLFANMAVHLALAIGFTALAFWAILPVQPGRKLFRAVEKIARSLRHALRHDRLQDESTFQVLSFDRLSQALVWAGARRPAGRFVLARAHGFAELDAALRRAWSRQDGAELATAGLADAVRGAAHELADGGPDALEHAAWLLLAQPASQTVPDAALRVASGLCEAGLLMRRQDRALRRYGLLGG